MVTILWLVAPWRALVSRNPGMKDSPRDFLKDFSWANGPRGSLASTEAPTYQPLTKAVEGTLSFPDFGKAMGANST